MAYETKILTSNKEFTTREKIKILQMSDCVSLDTVIKSGDSVDVDVETFAIIDVHNDKAQNTDYKVCILIDREGSKYKTGSETFMDTMISLYTELKEANELDEGFTLKCFKKPSKNFSGEFITCTLA